MRSPVLPVLACALLPANLADAADHEAYVPIVDPIVQLVALEYSPAAIAQKIRILERPAAPETLAALARCAVHPSVEVRLAAVQALPALGSASEVTRPLIAALADVDPGVQIEAVKGLGMVRNKAVLPQLRAIAGMTKSEDLRREAVKAITAITLE